MTDPLKLVLDADVANAVRNVDTLGGALKRLLDTGRDARGTIISQEDLRNAQTLTQYLKEIQARTQGFTGQTGVGGTTTGLPAGGTVAGGGFMGRGFMRKAAGTAAALYGGWSLMSFLRRGMGEYRQFAGGVQDLSMMGNVGSYDTLFDELLGSSEAGRAEDALGYTPLERMAQRRQAAMTTGRTGGTGLSMRRFSRAFGIDMLGATGTATHLQMLGGVAGGDQGMQRFADILAGAVARGMVLPGHMTQLLKANEQLSNMVAQKLPGFDTKAWEGVTGLQLGLTGLSPQRGLPMLQGLHAMASGGMGPMSQFQMSMLRKHYIDQGVSPGKAGMKAYLARERGITDPDVLRTAVQTIRAFGHGDVEMEAVIAAQTGLLSGHQWMYLDKKGLLDRAERGDTSVVNAIAAAGPIEIAGRLGRTNETVGAMRKARSGVRRTGLQAGRYPAGWEVSVQASATGIAGELQGLFERYNRGELTKDAMMDAVSSMADKVPAKEMGALTGLWWLAGKLPGTRGGGEGSGTGGKAGVKVGGGDSLVEDAAEMTFSAALAKKFGPQLAKAAGWLGWQARRVKSPKGLGMMTTALLAGEAVRAGIDGNTLAKAEARTIDSEVMRGASYASRGMEPAARKRYMGMMEGSAAEVAEYESGTGRQAPSWMQEVPFTELHIRLDNQSDRTATVEGTKVRPGETATLRRSATTKAGSTVR